MKQLVVALFLAVAALGGGIALSAIPAHHAAADPCPTSNCKDGR